MVPNSKLISGKSKRFSSLNNALRSYILDAAWCREVSDKGAARYDLAFDRTDNEL